MRIGLVLSGGGARGFAHLGVLKALEELQLSIHIISGVSSGAIVGAFYSAGYTPNEIFKEVTTTSFLRLMRLAFSKYGLIKLSELEEALNKYFNPNAFESLKRRLVVSATDFNKGVTVYFTEGALVKPLVASAAMPIICEAVTYQDRLLVDGGLLNNFPVECLLRECDYIIGVHTNPLNHQADVSSFRGVVERTFHMGINNNVRPRLKLCQFLIEPDPLKNYRLLDLKHAKQMFDIGYDYTLSLADNLFSSINKAQKGEKEVL